MRPVRPVRSLRVALFLARRALTRGNYGVTIMTILLMALIFVDVLFLPSLINGAIGAINRQVLTTTTSNLVVSSNQRSGTIDGSTAVLSSIRSTTGVAAATSTTRVGTEISSGSESNAWAVDAIDPGSYADVFTTPQHLIEGAYLAQNDSTGILLGIGIAGADQPKQRTYARSLKTVHTGDVVSVTMLGGKVHDFTVRGTYQNNFPLSDSNAFITYAGAATALPSLGDQATAIYVKATPGVSDTALQQALAPIQADLKFQTPEELTAAIQDQIDTFSLINNIMKVMSLLVAAITVFIITYVDLVNRRKQIGIERAIGITSGALVGSYVVKTIVNAVVGTVLGLLVFRFALVPYVAGHPFQFPNGPVELVTDPAEAVRNIVILILVAIVSVLIPAIRAVRMRILDAIAQN